MSESLEVKDFLIEVLHAQDSSRARSNQTEIGPSQVGDCRPRVWLQIKGFEGTNETLKLPAIMGTAIHKEIESAFNRYDPFGETFDLEGEVEYNGLKGHIDLYFKDTGEIVDWKTGKTKNLGYFPSREQRWQVHLYGYLKNKNGEPVSTVSLVMIPRDGDERDILTHTEPYNEAIALEAIDWLNDVKNRLDQPEPEKDALSFCQFYCEFYGGLCSGKEKPDKNSEVSITDETHENLALRYLEVKSQMKVLEAEETALKLSLEGISGVTPSKVLVQWTEVAGRSTIDEAALVKLLKGKDIPKKQGQGYLKLTVKAL